MADINFNNTTTVHSFGTQSTPASTRVAAGVQRTSGPYIDPVDEWIKVDLQFKFQRRDGQGGFQGEYTVDEWTMPSGGTVGKSVVKLASGAYANFDGHDCIIMMCSGSNRVGDTNRWWAEGTWYTWLKGWTHLDWSDTAGADLNDTKVTDFNFRFYGASLINNQNKTGQIPAFSNTSVTGIRQLSATIDDVTVDYNGEYHNLPIKATYYRDADRPEFPLSPASRWAGTAYVGDTDGDKPSGGGGVQGVISPDSEGLFNAIDGDGKLHVGTYTYYCMIEGHSYYPLTSTVSGTLTINKGTLVEGSQFTAPTGKTVPYNGSAQTLVNAGSLMSWGATKDEDNLGCKFEYRIKKSTESTWSAWSTTLPSATDAGTYNVEYRIVGNKDINDHNGGSFTATISDTSTTVIVHLPDSAGIRAAYTDGTIAWTDSTYDATNYTLTKVFDYGDVLDYPNIQSYINSSVYTMSTANTANNPSGYLMVGYSTSSTPTNLDYHEGKTTTLTPTAAQTIHLYPRLKWFNQSTYVGNFDNQNHKATMTPMTASGANRIAASGVTVKADTAAKNAPNAPTGSTVKSSSTTAGTAFDLTGNYKDAGIYRIGITITETADGETFTKTGHTTNNYINIKKAPRNIQLNPATISMETNQVKTAIVTGWDDLDNSAATASVLSASARATVTPATISKGGTVTITSGLAPGVVNINITIPETDNYLSETTPIVVTIAGQGNGIYWYNGTQWILTKPYVWNGSAWSEDFI